MLQIISFRPETRRRAVILRSEGTKNLEILRPTQRGTQDDGSSLQGACPERLDLSSSTGLAEGLRMTFDNFPMDTNYQNGFIISLCQQAQVLMLHVTGIVFFLAGRGLKLFDIICIFFLIINYFFSAATAKNCIKVDSLLLDQSQPDGYLNDGCAVQGTVYYFLITG